MTDDADATPATPDSDDHVARLQAEIDAVKARRAAYRAGAAATVARGGPAPATDEELGIIETDQTVGKIAADASQEIGSRLSRLMSRFRRGGKKRTEPPLDERQPRGVMDMLVVEPILPRCKRGALLGQLHPQDDADGWSRTTTARGSGVTGR